MSFRNSRKKIKPGLAKDGSRIMVVRQSEPWDNRRYLIQEEMKLKKQDFPEDTVFVTGGKMTPNRITEEHIDAIMEKSHFLIEMHGEKTTVVIATLPNGFVIVESSSCVDPKNYNYDLGVKLCKERIRDKIWMLEAYLIQSGFGMDGHISGTIRCRNGRFSQYFIVKIDEDFPIDRIDGLFSDMAMQIKVSLKQWEEKSK